jgi:mannose-1-phosphate guanylyltransferase
MRVNSYKHAGLWMDIGRVEDFQKAQQSWLEDSSAILGV